MTRVNVTLVTDTVVVTEGGNNTVVTVPETTTVTAITVGPQGPQGIPGPTGLVVDTTAKVDKSIVYYDGPTSQFKADATWTTSSLTDGGNF